MDLSSGWTNPSPFSEDAKLSLINSTTRMNVSPRTKLLLEILMVLMCLGAVTGNILVIVIVAATKTFHTVTSVLIINLAISDFLVGIGVMPFVAVSVLNNGWVNCADLCLYVGYTSSVYCTASVLTLAAIALDRYHSIMDCLRYDSRCTVCRTSSAVAWIWLQAMVTSSPPLLGWSRVSYVEPMYSCAVNWSSSPSYTAFMATLSFLLPAVVILFCYVKIVKVARGHARRIHDLEEHLQRSREAPAPAPVPPADRCLDASASSRLVYHLSGRFVSESQADRGPAPAAPSQPGTGRLHSFFTQLYSSAPPPPPPPPPHASNQHHGMVRLLLVISAFLLCWTPYMCIALVQAVETALSSPTSVPPSAVTFSYWLALLNSDINPLLYALLSQRFQGALRSLQRKLQSSLRGAGAGRGGGVRGVEPCTLSATNFHRRTSPENAPSERTAYHSSVISLDSETGYRERPGSVFLPGSASSSWQEGSRKCACGKVDRLQVPSLPQEGGRLPSLSAAKDRQATFFYGQITVRVERDVC